ncbi:MAG TPA: hypothetical protein VM695_02910 [Phycisphaerae bacterium]|nr:hypothetical protein [Phycisphaerae bacterium]
MIEWWNSLGMLNKVFYGAAGFFSLVFAWQFISSMIGLGGSDVDIDAGPHADVDTDIDSGVDAHGVDMDSIEAHSIEEAGESVVSFHILSVRAVLAFFTLFTWAGALYLDADKPVSHALVLATAWGLGAWVLVAVLIHWMRKLAETGTKQLHTCVGQRGTVYMDIPGAGEGQVRVSVSGVVSMVRARAAGGGPIPSGTPVRVLRMLDASSVEVAAAEKPAEEASQA